MELHELIGAKNIIMQIVWGDKKIEFHTIAHDGNKDGIYVSPYIHNGVPIEINIQTQSGVQCNIFSDDPKTHQRISWKNLMVNTQVRNDSIMYLITSSNFNRLSSIDERRAHERIVIHKQGSIWDELDKRFVQIMVHDISDDGISFYSPSSFIPIGGSQRIVFSDYVRDQLFQMEVECKVVRVVEKMGTIFYGCQLVGQNKDYLMYGCLKKLLLNSELKKQEEAQNEENY